MLMKVNFEFSKQKSFTRTGLQVTCDPQYIELYYTSQTTIALSKIATSSIPWSLSNLRKSLAVIIVYADNDKKVKVSRES